MKKIKKIKIVAFFLISIMFSMDLGSFGIPPLSQEGIFDEEKTIFLADIHPSSPLKSFNYYKNITFNSSKISGLVNHTNYSSYISIYDSDLKDKVKSDGSDLSFYSDLEKLDHEIEVFNQSYNSSHAYLAAWIKIPLLSPIVDTNITMYYGNSEISSQENPNGVWDANYKGVWHLNEDPGPGLTGDIKDSTINKKNGTTEPSMESNDSVAGQFYNSINFDGIDDYISIGNLSENVHTISFWMNIFNFNGSSQSTNWYSPGTATNVARTGSIDPWSNTDQTLQQNDSYSVADIVKGGYSDWLRFTNFSLNIPENAKINGIVIEIDRYSDKAGIGDDSIRLVLNGTVIGDDKNSSDIWPIIDTNTYAGYGVENDTWNSALTPIDINNATWGFQISAVNTRANSALVYSYIDHARVKVFYSENMAIIGINNTSHIEIDRVSNEIKTYNMAGASSIYVNGTLDSFVSLGWNYITITNTDGINSSSVNFGKDSVGLFNGSLDEIRFSTNIESGDLISTQYENQFNPDTFYYISQSYKTPPGDFLLNSTADDPDPDGNFDLLWNSSRNSDNYSIYSHVNFITEINASVNYIGTTTNEYWNITSYENGTDYFIVVASNTQSNVSSNCISVIVQDPPWVFDNLVSDGADPDPDGNFQLTWDASMGADNYGVWKYNSFITDINASLTFLTLTGNLYWDITGQTNGTWYYKIEATNEAGNSTSNCETQVVQDPPWVFGNLISSGADPDPDGNFQLTWDASTGADNYGVWQYNSFIIDINASLTFLTLTSNLYWDITGQTNGTWYYKIEATNDAGNSTSNCVTQVVQDPPWAFGNLASDGADPDPDGNFRLTWDASTGADNYGVWQYDSYITDINASLTFLTLTSNLYLDITGQTNGTWYYKIEATNDAGNSTSNCETQVVQDPPWAFGNLASDGADPDPDGDFQLTWDASTEADNYGVWQYDSFITDINASLTFLTLTSNLYWDITSQTNGTWYYKIEATNDAGNSTSNCETQVVQDPPWDFGNLASDGMDPDPDGNFQLTWDASTGADNYGVWQYNSFITDINASLTFLTLTSNLYWDITSQTNGTWYYKIEAVNEAGNTTSNCISVIVQDPPWDFTLSHDADNPDQDGDFQLYWDASFGADNYSVYYYDQLITQINGSVNYLGTTTNEFYDITDFANGTWYFIIEASNNAANNNGNTTSNCVSVIVQDSPWEFTLSHDADSPDDDGDFQLMWDTSNGADNYSVWYYENLIVEINGSVNYLDITINEFYDISVFANGTWFFIIVAVNEVGNETSNCVSITVQDPPLEFPLYNNADNPDTDANFDLFWDTSNGADNYSVYRYSSWITDINGSVEYIDTTTNEYWNFTGHSDGNWYFIVEATNEYSDTISNCIVVVVESTQPPEDLEISENADSPDHDGNFDITWNQSLYADNYTVYRYNGWITEINGSVEFIETVTTLYYNFSSHTNGTWYYIVIAANNDGNKTSNCVSVTVQDPPWQFTSYKNADSPDPDGNFDIYWDLSSGADNYSVYRYSTWITEINGSVEYIDTTTNEYWNFTSHSNGTFYFMVTANNEAGSTTSNCIEITVQDPPWDFTLSHDADSPDADGDFQLTWDASFGADKYTVYRYDQWIVQINDSLTILSVGITVTYFNIVDWTNGTWYYTVEATNFAGNTTSNCAEVDVKDPPWDFTLSSDADIPDLDGDYKLTWDVSQGADNYSVYEFDSWIVQINGSISFLGTTTNEYYDITDQTNGTWFYLVIASNNVDLNDGNTSSNCVEVTVQDGPWEFTIYNNADNPDTDANFDIFWETSSGADNYSVYRFNAWITEINGSVEYIDTTTNEYWNFTGHSDGTWYFIVKATNEYSDVKSNCIEIIVESTQPPQDFELLENADSPDHDGNFDITWNQSLYATNYTIYRFNSWITEINGSLEFIGTVTTLYYNFSSHTNGTWYYIIESRNNDGNTSSNCVFVTVQDAPWEFTIKINADSPDPDGNFDIYWDASFGVVNYTVYRYNTWITEINGSLANFGTTTNEYWNFTSHINGSWYFMVTANNEAGNTTSDCLEITVQDPPWEFTLSHDADSPDADGDLQLTWDVSFGADNYSVYYYDQFITQINGSVNYLETTTNTYYDIIDFSNGTWFFIIEASNNADDNNGNTSSNCVSVIIQDSPWSFTLSDNADDPDTDSNFDIYWDTSNGADNYNVYRYTAWITDINGSVEYIDTTTNEYWNFTGYSDGIWYFIIEATNEAGNKTSNCVEIKVLLPSNPPQEFTLTHNADNPDVDGAYNLSWSSSVNAENYTVYTHSSFIVDINGSVQVLSLEQNNLDFSIINSQQSTYYYIIKAQNEIGSILSNCIKVVVMHPPGSFVLSSDVITSSPDGNFNIFWTESAGAYNYSIYTYDKRIFEINHSLDLLIDSSEDLSFNLLNQPDGLYYFIVESKNEAGVRISNYVKVLVDSSSPEFIIHSDVTGLIFDDNSPTINITIIDISLNMAWYIINTTNFQSEAKIISISQGMNSIQMDQGIWELIPDGDGTIIFYANDSLGRLTQVEISFTKQSFEGQELQTPFPFWIIFLLVGLVGAFSATYLILSKKRKTSIKTSNKEKPISKKERIKKLINRKNNFDEEARNAINSNKFNVAASLFKHCSNISVELISLGLKREEKNRLAYGKLISEMKLKSLNKYVDFEADGKEDDKIHLNSNLLSLIYSCISDVLTKFFDQKSIKYYSLPQLHLDGTEMIYGALDNRKYYIQEQLKKAGNEKLQSKLKIELNKCEEIKIIQIIFTPDLSDTSNATLILRFFRSDAFLFIVGMNADLFKNGEIMDLPVGVALDFEDNIRIVSYKLFSQFLGLKGKHKRDFEWVVKNYLNEEKLLEFHKLHETKIHDAFELTEDMNKRVA